MERAGTVSPRRDDGRITTPRVTIRRDAMARKHPRRIGELADHSTDGRGFACAAATGSARRGGDRFASSPAARATADLALWLSHRPRLQAPRRRRPACAAGDYRAPGKWIAAGRAPSNAAAGCQN